MYHGVFFFLVGLIAAFIATDESFTMFEQIFITVPALVFMFAGVYIIRSETKHSDW